MVKKLKGFFLRVEKTWNRVVKSSSGWACARLSFDSNFLSFCHRMFVEQFTTRRSQENFRGPALVSIVKCRI